MRSPAPQPPSVHSNGHPHQQQHPFAPTKSAAPSPLASATPPTEPRALREKLQINPANANAKPPPDAPKGPKGHFVGAQQQQPQQQLAPPQQPHAKVQIGAPGSKLAMAGVPTGPRGSTQVKKFFPGDDDDDEDMVVTPAGTGGAPKKSNGWAMDVEKKPSTPSLTLMPATPLPPAHSPAPVDVAPAAPLAAVGPPSELYERLVQVGEGTYGKVYKARNVETGGLVALKRIRMEAEKDGFPVTAVREIKLLQSLRHPNVVDLKEMMVSKGHVYMVFEYSDHDLTGVLHHPSINLSPAHLKSLMQQFLDGLGFIHRRGVLHRDLKGSNILLSKHGELKIADFGLARFYARGRNNDYTNRVITQWYKPPELLFGATVYGAEVDMWSAGCIFLELFARRPVFQGQDEIHQLEVIFKVTGTPSVASWPGLQDLPWYELVKPRTVLPSLLRDSFQKWLSPAGLDVAERLLSMDPAKRPTADEARDMEYFREDPQPEMPDV
ncbi:hypothetical protein RQP46_010441 [Phenoliferia psychrophenolica]